MTSREIGGTSQKVSNLVIYLCFELCTLNSWVYNKKPILLVAMGCLTVFYVMHVGDQEICTGLMRWGGFIDLLRRGVLLATCVFCLVSSTKAMKPLCYLIL